MWVALDGSSNKMKLRGGNVSQGSELIRIFFTWDHSRAIFKVDIESQHVFSIFSLSELSVRFLEYEFGGLWICNV